MEQKKDAKITVSKFFRILLGMVFYSAFAIYLLAGYKLDASLVTALILFTLIYPVVLSEGG
jgi:hypothetical protein